MSARRVTSWRPSRGRTGSGLCAGCPMVSGHLRDHVHLDAVDVELLRRGVHALGLYALLERRHLQNFEILVTRTLEPVFGAPRHENAFVLAKFADDDVAGSVEFDAATQDKPE